MINTYLNSSLEIENVVGVHLIQCLVSIKFDCYSLIGKLRSMCDRKNDIELSKVICKTVGRLLCITIDKDELLYIINNFLYE